MQISARNANLDGFGADHELLSSKPTLLWLSSGPKFVTDSCASSLPPVGNLLDIAHNHWYRYKHIHDGWDSQKTFSDSVLIESRRHYSAIGFLASPKFEKVILPG